jgi:hypothetical protein
MAEIMVEDGSHIEDVGVFRVKDILAFGLSDDNTIVVKTLWSDGSKTWEKATEEICNLKAFKERSNELIGNSGKSLKELLTFKNSPKHKQSNRNKIRGCGSCLDESCEADELTKSEVTDLIKMASAHLQVDLAASSDGCNSSTWRSMQVSHFNEFHEPKYLHYCLLRAFNNAVGESYLSGKDMFTGQAYRCFKTKEKFCPSSKGDWRIGDLIHCLWIKDNRANRFRLRIEAKAHLMKFKLFFLTDWPPGRYILVFSTGKCFHCYAMIYSKEKAYFVDDSFGIMDFNSKSLQKYSGRQILSLHEIQEKS